MTRESESIKYVVTEGGGFYKPHEGSPRCGDKFLCGDGIATANLMYAGSRLILTELSTPPLIERGVVEPLVAAAKRLNDRWHDRNADPWTPLHDGLAKALAATEEALNPKPRERYETDEDEDGNWSVIDTQNDELVAHAATLGDAEAFAEALNAQVGDK